MYARLLTGFAEQDQDEDFPTRFVELLLPRLTGAAGFKSLYIMKSAAGDKYVVLVLWESAALAEERLEHYLQEQWPLLAGLLHAPPSAETLEVVLRA